MHTHTHTHTHICGVPGTGPMPGSTTVLFCSARNPPVIPSPQFVAWSCNSCASVVHRILLDLPVVDLSTGTPKSSVSAVHGAILEALPFDFSYGCTNARVVSSQACHAVLSVDAPRLRQSVCMNRCSFYFCFGL